MWQYLLFDRIMVNNRSVKSFAGQITVNNISVDILMVDGSGMGGGDPEIWTGTCLGGELGVSP